MADTTQAAFEEVLQLSVDVDGFAQQMDQVVAIYSAALEKMPSLDAVAGSGLGDALSKLQDTIESFSENSGEAFDGVANSVTDAASLIEASMSAAADAIAAAESRIVDSLTEIKDAEAETAESSERSGAALSGFVGGLTESLTGMARVVVLYRAISEAMNLVEGAITAPFKAIAEGFNYLENVQDRASVIKAALLQSVSYSKDWGENVELAGQQADTLVRKIDDIAVKLKVSSQAVQTGFTSFLEYGGRHLTGSVDEALQVSSLVTGALQTQRPNLDSRVLISEMQRLAQGAAQDSDKLAAALGLSKQQLLEMVTHAQKYHDLLQEILAYAPGIADRISEANNRESALVATLELYKERWEALIAGPLFQQFTKILQNILGWVDANNDKLTALGNNLGSAIGQLATGAQNFIHANWDGLVSTFGTLAKLAISIGAQIAQMLNATGALVQLGEKAHSLIGGPSAEQQDITERQNKETSKIWSRSLSQNPITTGRQLWDEAMKTRTERQGAEQDRSDDTPSLSGIFSQTWNNGKSIDAGEASAKALIDKITSGEAFAPSQSQSAPLLAGTPLDNLHPKGQGSHDELKAYQQELRDEITKTDGAYKRQTDAVHDALAKNTINHQQAADQIKTLSQQELTQIQTLIQAYQAKAKASGAKPAQVSSAVASMQRELDQRKNQSQSEIDQAQKAADAESEAVAKAHLAALYALEVQHQKERLALVKQGQTDGYLTQLQAFDQETSVLEAEHALQDVELQRQIASYAQGTVAYENAVNKRTALDDQYTANATVRAQQRIALAKKEQQAQFAHSVDMSRAGVTLQGSISSTSNHTASERSGDAAQQLRLQTQLTEATLRNTAALLAEAQAKNANSDATRNLEQQLAAEQNTRIQQFGQAIQQSAARAGTNTGLGRVYASNTASEQITAVQSQLNQLNQQLQASELKAMNDRNPDDQAGNQQHVQALKAEIDALTSSLQNMQKVADSLSPSLTHVAESLEDSLLGPQFSANIKQLVSDLGDAHTATADLTAGFEGAADGLSSLTNLGKAITGAFAQYTQGEKQGGVLGGVGSLLTSGPVSDLLSAVPVVGSIVKPLGEAFSFIGDMFVDEAKKIAANIEKATQNIQTAYSENQITLTQAIQELQQQEQDAISQLSGVKGGQSQLDQILPGLEQQIQSLENQAASTMKTFTDTLTQLTAGGTELQSWVQTWQQINQQVANYLAAGGDMNTANQYLQAQLQQQLTSVTDSLVQGDQQAIQDAINLNNLLQQRVDLVRQEQETEFGIENQNAIEKRESTGVQVASQLQNQRISYDEQLDDLNYQITTAQQKVQLESQVFQIASDTATLEAQSNQLTLYSLQEQLLVYQQMQDIVKTTSGLQFTGGFSGSVPGTSISGASGIAGVAPPITINLSVDATGQDVNSQQFSNYLAAAIQAQVTANRTTP